MAKLTEKKVKSIRDEYVPYKTTRDELAAKYGVSKATINQILMRKTWRHVA
jgi:DNA-binding XRE family transcriptional regulator